MPIEGILTIDPGSSLTKIFYRHTGCSATFPAVIENRYLMLMNAGVEEITSSRYDQHSSDSVFRSGLDQSVVQCLGRYWAIASSPGNHGSVRKLESAIVKTLAVIGHVSTALPMADSGLNLSLGLLLPFDEYGDRNELIKLLSDEIKAFGFNGQIAAHCELTGIRVVPEGYGLFRAERSPLMGCLICGHRDVSWLHVENGRPIPEKCLTFSGGGFRKFLRILGEYFPIKDELMMTKLISTMPSENHRTHFQSVLQSVDDCNRLVSAITDSRNQYWLSLKEWLSQTSINDVDVVAINGGSAPFLKDQLKEQIPRIAWGKDAMFQLKTIFDIRDRNMAHRLCDNFSFFKTMGGCAVE